MKWLRLETQRYPLRQGETTIGRSAYCSIQLTSLQASREHASVVVRGDVVTLSDLSSRNGTFVNGRRIRLPTVLGIGDRVTIGGLEMCLFESEAAPDSSASTQENLAIPRICLETTAPDLTDSDAACKTNSKT